MLRFCRAMVEMLDWQRRRGENGVKRAEKREVEFSVFSKQFGYEWRTAYSGCFSLECECERRAWVDTLGFGSDMKGL